MSNTLLKGIDDQAELARLAAYVAQTMSDAEVEQFEAELRADAEFFDRMSPLLAVWYAREPLPALAREIETMRAEVAEIREVRVRRRQIGRHIATALGSALTIKGMIGTSVVAATALVAAVGLYNSRSSQTLTPPPTYANHSTPRVPTQVPPQVPTQVATAAAAPVRRHPTPRVRVAEVPLRLPVLDPSVERAVDSMVAAPLVGGVTGTKVDVVATGPVADSLPPVPLLAWAPQDTTAVPKLDNPIDKVLSKGRDALGGLVRLPGRIFRGIFGGRKP